MKKSSKIALSSAVLAAAGVSALSCSLASFAAHGKRQTLEEARSWQEEHYDISWYAPLQKESYFVKSFDDYELHVQLCRPHPGSERYVIISHGYTDNRYGALKYMRIYLDRGYNCIIYDLRGHGKNEPAICTYSIREGQDLYELIKDTRQRYPDLEELGLHGESLGAASTVSSLGYRTWARADHIPEQYVDWAVADCGFADIENVLKGAMKAAFHLPGFLTGAASAASKLRYGFSFSQMRPIEMLDGNRVPICFIHGAEDTFITPENSRRMAEATSGYSEVNLIDGAQHANSVLTDPEKYREIVYAFLDRVHADEAKA